MTSDLDLLRQFARENSQDAFGEIVRRHLDLVYSAALRQVRSPQLAEDVAQAVFAVLARDAHKLRPDTILTAWLYAVARRTAIDTIRKESRRQLREQTALEMNAMNATAEDWAHIAPLLDDAMAALEETDRAAILLRFFENKSLREVGESLKISDDAAQKRVSRAVERLRECLSKEHVAMGAAAVTVLISANAVKAAPTGLAATISAALAGTAAQSATLIAATKTIAVTTLQKSLIVAGLAAVAGVGIYATCKNSGLESQMEVLQHQRAPLAAQLQDLQAQLADDTNQLAAALAQNAQNGSGVNSAELIRLRGEVAQLEANEASRHEDPIASAAENWLGRVKILKDYLALHPEEKIPELQYLSDKDWLQAAGTEFNSTGVVENAAQILKFNAETDVGQSVLKALSAYSSANNGQFPDDLSELQPYLDPDMGNMLEQLYEVVPSSIVHDTITNNGGSGVTIRYNTPPGILGQRVLIRKERPNPTSTSRLAIFAGGFTYWQSPPGTDNSQ